jgi:hypothetical protein
MTASEIQQDRVTRLFTSPELSITRPPRDIAWPLALPIPPDLRALYAVCDGLKTRDGFTLLGKGELKDVTDWLVLDKGLGWPSDYVVVGERHDMVVVVDLDVEGTRGGGGVLEAPNDALESFEPAACDLVAYLEARVGLASDRNP